jgi:hypothetical protein
LLHKRSRTSLSYSTLSVDHKPTTRLIRATGKPSCQKESAVGEALTAATSSWVAPILRSTNQGRQYASLAIYDTIASLWDFHSLFLSMKTVFPQVHRMIEQEESVTFVRGTMFSFA